ncbi:MAG: hypothetical protein CVU77_03605 [Elusimicrobia bacterium HGW-Elusimicrobia-1]|nr:MAG: hypothetical protein CVU77_03605 [Elusimicrobia bacterium HGW-Elusimicrobia-1]
MNPFSLDNPVTPAPAPKTSSGIMINLRLRYARNILKFPFPPAMKKNDAEQLWREVSSALGEHELFRDGGREAYLPSMRRAEKMFLAERRILSPDMLKSRLPGGAIFSSDEKYVVLVNEEDHLRISVTEPDAVSAASAASRLASLEKFLASKFECARSTRYGFLTSCPSNLGSAFRVSALFHLGGSVLAKRADDLLDSVEKKGYYVRGYYGEKSRYYGDVYQISTGDSPDPSSAGRVIDFLTGIEAKEQGVRDLLLSPDRSVSSSDIIWRAWGIMSSARLMSFAESLSLISLIMLGNDIGLGIPVSRDVLQRLMTECQPAHIQAIAGREMTAVERDEYRADYIRGAVR